jgi:hypothetical protein
MPYGRDLFDLDISPDGATLIGSMSEIGGSQRLVRMDVAALMQGDTTHEVLADFAEWAPSNFVFSPDGRYLFGSSYYSGVSNIFRYDFATGGMEPLSNAETGFFRPVPISQDSVLVFRYTGRGFVPSMIANEVPDSVSAIHFLGNEIAARRTEVQEWMVPPASNIDLDSLTTDTGTYRAHRQFKLDAAYPIVEGYRDAAGTYSVAAGVRLNFSDRIGTTAFDLTSSYSVLGEGLASDERLHIRAALRHWNWRIRAGLNPADFYDLFGPTLTSRAGYGLGVQYDGMLIFDPPKNLGYTLQVAGYGGLKTLPEYQGVAAPYTSLLSFSGNLAYASLRKSLGGIDDELGTTWGVTLRSNYANDTVFARVSFDVSHGLLLPLDHSSLWFRASVGTALAGRAGPFANFYFGGFGNNWVDHRAVRQFRETRSFPGIDINTVGGANYGRAQLEWTTPPLRFRRVGIPSFYLRWAALSLFTTGLVTDLDDAATRRQLASVGAQLDLRLVTLSHLKSTLSFGYAVAGGTNAPLGSAFMFSFKIM